MILSLRTLVLLNRHIICFSTLSKKFFFAGSFILKVYSRWPLSILLDLPLMFCLLGVLLTELFDGVESLDEHITGFADLNNLKLTSSYSLPDITDCFFVDGKRVGEQCYAIVFIKIE